MRQKDVYRSLASFVCCDGGLVTAGARQCASVAFILPYLPRIGAVADDHDLGSVGEQRMILRSAFTLAVGLVGLGLVGFAENAQAQQPYPPYGAQQGYNPYRPVPSATVPDDDDDIPANQLATPGAYPPPPSRGGGYVEREALPPPGAPAPYYGNRQPPAVAYGDRNGNYPPQQPYGGRPVGNGQPESYGAPQQGYGPRQGYAPNQAAIPQQGESYQQGYQSAPGQGPMQLGTRPPG